MTQRRPQKKDRTGMLISVVAHVVVVAAVLYWAHTTGHLNELRERFLEFVRSERERRVEEAQAPKPDRPPPPPPPPSSELPKSVTPPASSGSRRAVASDAPAAMGETFFVDTRSQSQGKSKGDGGGIRENLDAKLQETKKAPAPKPPKLFAFKPPESSIKQIFLERSEAVAATEAVGSEQISKSGASDVGAIVGKIASATVVEGKFAVIRGLGDRYVPTLLNGAAIPSSDPYRRSASLDQFPAQVIDKVTVTKTFTPDLPGTFTGGGVNIETKTFPEKGFVKLSLGGAYNTQTTGNERFLQYEGGSTDWLGMDDGARELPDSVAPGTEVLSPEVLTPRPGDPSFPEKVRNAETLEQQTKDLGPTQFKAAGKAPPWDHNFGLSFGDTTHFLGVPIGVLGTANYTRKFAFYDDGEQSRYFNGDIPKTKYLDVRSLETVNWAVMGNLAAQFYDNHDLSLNYLFSQTSQDTARSQSGFSSSAGEDDTVYLEKLQFLERNLNTFQLKGSSRFPDLGGVKLDYLAAMTGTTQDEPDTRFFNYASKGNDIITGGNFLPDPQNPTRYFSNMEEQNKNVRLDLTIPFRHVAELEGELKLGVNGIWTDREFYDRLFTYPYDDRYAPWEDGDPNSYLSADNLGANPRVLSNGRIRWNWMRWIEGFGSTYEAESAITAAYMMMDLEVAKPLRLVGGVRAERTALEINSISPFANSVTGLKDNSTELNQTDFLPAIGLIYSLRDDMKLRANFSQTLSRPSFRELAAYRSYDPNLDAEVEGNPELQIASIQNYDLRWEWFPHPGEILSVSVFYKKLTNPIEKGFIRIDSSILSWENRDSASVMGVEFEARKNLGFIDRSLSYFSFGGNLSLIKSETDLSDDEFEIKSQYISDLDRSRSIAEQSPYILNLDLSYDNPRWGTSVSLVYNIFGPRLIVSSLTTEDIYEQPAASLDLVYSQRIGRNLSVKFSAKNLLNPLRQLTYGEDSDLIWSSHRRGQTFGLSLAYEF